MFKLFTISLLKTTKAQILAIVLVSFLVYANSLQNRLLWDDHLFLEQWPQIQNFQNLGEILKGSAPPAQGKIYRPIRGVIYMIDYRFWGTNPLGYRLQAVLIHLLSTLLVYFIARELVKGKELMGEEASMVRRLGKKGTNDLTSKLYRHPNPITLNYLPFITALLFGLHPIHTETIDYISTSMESFGTVFFFSGFWLYLLAKRIPKKAILFYAGSIIFAGLAFFTYEMTLTLPVLLVLYEITLGINLQFKIFNFQSIFKIKISKLKFLYKTLPYFGLALLFLLVRFSMLGLVSRTDYLGYSFYLTMLVMVKVFVRYIGLLLIPLNQTAIHNLVGDFPSSMIPYDSLEPVLSQTVFDTDVLLSIATVLILIAVAVKYIKKYQILSFSILWFFISLLPVSYIIPHGGAMAEKYLYIPSFGFIFLLSFFLIAVYEFKWAEKLRLRFSAEIFLKQLLVFLFVLFLVLYSGLTFARNTVWKDDISLFSDVLNKSPGNLMANYNLGIWYGNFDMPDKAISHYLAAIQKAPGFWEARMNLGNIYIRTGSLDNAEDEFKKVLRLKPGLKAVENSLSNLPAIKSSTDSARLYGSNVFVRYKTKTGLEFFFPYNWSVDELRRAVSEKEVRTGKNKTVKDENVGLIVQSPENFKIQIMEDKTAGSMKDYIKNQSENHGQLVNEGLAQIPNIEQAYVKVWKGDNVQKLQFFLFGEKKVVQMIVYPADSPDMRLLDLLLGSVKIN